MSIRRPRQPPAAVLGDLVRDGLRLRVDCIACGRSALLKPADVAKSAGYDAELPRLRWRLKCTKCGGQGMQIEVRVARPEEPPGVYLGR